MDTKYEGLYRVAGNVLTREGCILHVCTRTHTTATKSGQFLVDKTTAPGQYVSSLYGREFEFRGTRYGIDWTGDGTAIVKALKRSRGST